MSKEKKQKPVSDRQLAIYFPLPLKRKSDGWWITGTTDAEIPEYGPYHTKTEAEESRRGIRRFFQNDDLAYHLRHRPHERKKRAEAEAKLRPKLKPKLPPPSLKPKLIPKLAQPQTLAEMQAEIRKRILRTTGE